MITSLHLGTLNFPVNMIQGPLAGVSCAPFRALTWQYGNPAFSCTEMISCKTLIHQPIHAHRRFVEKDPQEGPVCFQLSSTDPCELAEAVKIVTDCGADLIDLNCGCPVKKIRSRGAGSRLLIDPTKLYALMTAMKKNTHVPVSIKIRVDDDSDEKYNADVAKAVHDAGADFLVVHGRHWTEKYDKACRYDQIRFFVEALNIPVIGNGDIADIISLKKMFETGCAGVMIGRAGVGQPWLIQQLMAEMRGETFSKPSSKKIGEMFLMHVQGLVELLENERFAVFQARSFAKYYGRRLADKLKFCEALNTCEGWREFEKIVNLFFN